MNGRVLAAAGADGQVRLYDVADPLKPRPLGRTPAEPADGFRKVAFSPDGRTLAGAGNDGTVRLWDVRDPVRPQPLHPLPRRNEYLTSLAFSPHGHVLAVGDTQVRLWDVRDPARPKPLARVPAHVAGNVYSLAFSPDGLKLAVGDNDSTIRCWYLDDPAHPRPMGRPIRHDGFLSSVNALAFSSDGTELASASDDIRRWEPVGGTMASRPLGGTSDDISDVAYSPDGYTFAGTDGRVIRLWNIAGQSELRQIGRTLTGHTGQVKSLGFSPDGRTLASGSDDGTVRLWNVQAGRLTDRSMSLNEVAFSPDSRTLAAFDDLNPHIWDITRPTRPKPLGLFPTWPTDRTPGINGYVAVDAGWRTLATIGDERDGNRSLRLWRLRAPYLTERLGPPLAPRDSFQSVWFSPGGRLMAAVTTDSSVLLWDLADPAHPKGPTVLHGPSEGIPSPAFAPDGRTLALAVDGVIRLWDVTDPARPSGTRTLPDLPDTATSLAFSPDGRTLAGTMDRWIKLWNVTDPVRPPQALAGPDDGLGAVAFSPDGHTLAGAGYDGTVWLWRVLGPGRAELRGRPLHGHTGTVSSVTFSPDGRLLASAGQDQSVQLWELDAESNIRGICAATAGAMTPDVWRRYVGADASYDPPCS
nr:WD40 repeat domain-containing protein [Nonomuraea sp. FMUSA5-5]